MEDRFSGTYFVKVLQSGQIVDRVRRVAFGLSLGLELAVFGCDLRHLVQLDHVLALFLDKIFELVFELSAVVGDSSEEGMLEQLVHIWTSLKVLYQTLFDEIIIFI